MSNKPNLYAAETFYLAKAYYNIHNAVNYFNEILKSDETGHHAKTLVKQLKIKMDWVLLHSMTDFGAATSQKMREQLGEWKALDFENVFDEMLLMDDEKRARMYQIANAYRKGDIEVMEVEQIEEAA